VAERTLVAGLGNPGPEYERTRHNIGFRVADELARRLDATFKRSKHEALTAEAHDGDTPLLIAKPQTYMNDSGRAVSGLARYYRVPPERTIVVHDELDLPFGVVRVKLGGGTAGHNGVSDVASAIGTGFARVRIGVGRPPGRKDPVDFVLEPFSKREEAEVSAIVDLGADAVLAILRDGISAAQTAFNQRVSEGPVD
jgi:peptidyl-tRNA hydrolase, PTH1 family